MSNILLKKVVGEILIRNKLSFDMSKIFLKKVIKEVLIKNNFLRIKHPFKESYPRTFDQKIIFMCQTSFYV